MRKTDIEKIIKGGSVRQKIKLYMTDIALVNVDMNNLNLTEKEGELIINGTPLLTNKERDLLWESIKEPQDVKYYNNLRIYNASFLLFKDKLSTDIVKLSAYYMMVAGMYKEYEANDGNREIIDELLDLYPDKKSRAKAHKLALEKTKDWGGKTYQEKGYEPYLEIDITHYFNQVSKPVEAINKTIQSAKTFIRMFKLILSKDLPLQPYKDWVKKEENYLIELIKNIAEFTTDLEGYSSGDYTQLLTYEKIDVNITEDDIEDFKSAGL